jgi:DNA-binding response OmpR family regulator
MDGATFIREVRARGYTMPALAVTAVGGGQRREQLRAAGFDGYVAKPVLPGELAAAINAAIATRT